MLLKIQKIFNPLDYYDSYEAETVFDGSSEGGKQFDRAALEKSAETACKTEGARLQKEGFHVFYKKLPSQLIANGYPYTRGRPCEFVVDCYYLEAQREECVIWKIQARNKNSESGFWWDLSILNRDNRFTSRRDASAFLAEQYRAGRIDARFAYRVFKSAG